MSIYCLMLTKILVNPIRREDYLEKSELSSRHDSYRERYLPKGGFRSPCIIIGGLLEVKPIIGKAGWSAKAKTLATLMISLASPCDLAWLTDIDVIHVRVLRYGKWSHKNSLYHIHSLLSWALLSFYITNYYLSILSPQLQLRSQNN